MSYLRSFARTMGNVPQNEPMEGMEKNNTGVGYSFQTTPLQRLRSFLILGAEGGTFYVRERQLTKENAQTLVDLLESGRGVDVVKMIEEVSVSGASFRVDACLFGLAMAAHTGDAATKAAVREAFTKVVRIPTHLFTFVAFSESIAQATRGGTGWGRAMRRLVSSWYNERSAANLALMVTKYVRRGGWSHVDLLRLAHTKADSEATGAVLKYVAKGWDGVRELVTDDALEQLEPTQREALQFIVDVEAAACLSDPAADSERMAALIRERSGLVREHVPTPLLNSAVVWRALLEKMPAMAMVRNLGKMSAIGLFDGEGGSAAEAHVLATLRNRALLRRARLHPFAILLALKTYRQGRGDKGKLSWPVNKRIADALDSAFYLSFATGEGKGSKGEGGGDGRSDKSVMLALDVSGSMGTMVMGSSISCREASAAMAMVAVNTMRNVEVVAFTSSITNIDLRVQRGMKLDRVVSNISGMPFGGTDCALPMLYAMERKRRVDAFVVYTDSETWFGDVHPCQALQRYRRAMNMPQAKLIVVGMASNGFTIADPNDRGMLDVVGFDASAPEVMQAFIDGAI